MDYELLFGKKRKTRRSPKRRSPKRKTSSKKLSKKMLNSCPLKCLRKLALRYKVSIYKKGTKTMLKKKSLITKLKKSRSINKILKSAYRMKQSKRSPKRTRRSPRRTRRSPRRSPRRTRRTRYGNPPLNTPEELAQIIKGHKREIFSPEAKARMQKGNDYEPIVRDYLAKKGYRGASLAISSIR